MLKLNWTVFSFVEVFPIIFQASQLEPDRYKYRQADIIDRY